jgi:hypothetical protein
LFGICYLEFGIFNQFGTPNQHSNTRLSTVPVISAPIGGGLKYQLELIRRSCEIS